MPSLSSESPETTPSPYINRFVQPDTIIPDLSNPQSWNRFGFVMNRINAPVPVITPVYKNTRSCPAFETPWLGTIY